MKKFAQFLTVILVLISVITTESFPYMLQESTATERCDDLRETEVFRIATSNIKVSKVVQVCIRYISENHIVETTTANFQPTHSLSEFLYLRLRVLRN